MQASFKSDDKNGYFAWRR